MYSLFLTESLKDGLESYGCKINSALDFSKVKEFLDGSEFANCQAQTAAILGKLQAIYPGLPISVEGFDGVLDKDDDQFESIYHSTGLSTNTVEASQMLDCAVTRDGYLIMTLSSDKKDDTLLERVIMGMEDTKSIDDIFEHEVTVYHCQISI